MTTALVILGILALLALIGFGVKLIGTAKKAGQAKMLKDELLEQERTIQEAGKVQAGRQDLTRDELLDSLPGEPDKDP